MSFSLNFCNIQYIWQILPFILAQKLSSPKDYANLIPKTLDPLYKGGVIVPLMEVIYSNQMNHKNFTLKVLKEYLLDIPIVYLFPKNFYLMDEINEKMGVLKAAGLVSLWMDRYLDKRYVNVEDSSGEPKVLSVQDLKGGFEMYFLGVFTSIIVFVLERISLLRCMKFLRKIIEN